MHPPSLRTFGTIMLILVLEWPDYKRRNFTAQVAIFPTVVWSLFATINLANATWIANREPSPSGAGYHHDA
jgi:hypothetical protein